MKRLFYILTSILLLASCSDETDAPNKKAVKEGDPVTLTFSVNMPDELMVQTRTLGENTMGSAQRTLNLWLFVYDSEGIFVQAAKATRGNTDEHSGTGHYDTKFSVTLNATSSQRIIHFIAYDGGENEGVGTLINGIANQFGTESSMLSQLYTTGGQAAYWHRLTVEEIVGDDETTPNIDESTKFTCVPLVRNFAKIIVKNSAAGFTLNSFTVVNAPSKGTVAPYNNGQFVSYVDGTTNKTYNELISYPGSAPAGMTTTDYTTADLQSAASPFYLYETPNVIGNAKGRTTVIIYGKNGTNPDAYYKVDLVRPSTNEAEGNVFYNILRNFAYTITITEVLGAGYSTLQAAIAGAAGNNLSASTATSSLSAISDGKQKLEVTNTYFCFTDGEEKQVLKFRYSYLNGNTWTYNNNLIRFTNSNDAMYENSTPTIPSTNNMYNTDAEGWSTIVLDPKTPSVEAQTSTIHLYASQTAINDAGLQNVITGELLSRDVRVDLRNQYTLLVDCPTYVKKETGTAFTVNLLIPQGINDMLFPMDFLIEPQDKTINPDATATHRLPVHIGPTIVNTFEENSFQYVRTVKADEYASLGTKTVNGVTYKVVPCEFKTNEAASATTVYAYNEYFSSTPEAFSNDVIYFTDESVMTITGTENYGLGWDVTLNFSVTQDAVNKTFDISITEGTTTNTYTYTPTAAGPQTYTYQTKTFGESSVSATITANNQERPGENRTATSNVARHYFFIKANSFTTNINGSGGIGASDDQSSIYVDDYETGYVGNGYGESPYDGSVHTNRLTANGLLYDYRIDANYATKPEGVTDNLVITENSVIKFEVYESQHRGYYATTTAGDLDRARREASYRPALVFVAPGP